jgi:hypothetical protein
MTRPSIPGSMAVKRRIARWSAGWQEEADMTAEKQSSSANVQQQLSLSTREVVESLKHQWNNEHHADRPSL